MVCEAAKEIRKLFNANKKQMLEKMKTGTDGQYMVADFDVQKNVVYITDPLGVHEYKKFMKDNPNELTEFDFYMVIYCGRTHTYQKLNRCFAEHLYEYITSPIGCFIPDGTSDLYLNQHAEYTTKQLNEMIDAYGEEGKCPI
jgi:bifunctional DNA-binding transcriptional regulator/antitoxin component of YhaV-PrlF toxin-antitoxin module